MSAKKKKKADVSQTEESPEAPPGQGTPEGDALRAANAALAGGNYVRVRELITPLFGARDPAVAAAARDLGERIAVDRVQVGVLVAVLCVVVSLFWAYVR